MYSSVKKNLRQSMNISKQKVLKSTGHRTNTRNIKRKNSDSSSKLTQSYTSPLKSYAKSVMSTTSRIGGEKNISKM